MGCWIFFFLASPVLAIFFALGRSQGIFCRREVYYRGFWDDIILVWFNQKYCTYVFPSGGFFSASRLFV